MGLSVLMKSWTRKARHTTWSDAASGGRGFARKAVLSDRPSVECCTNKSAVAVGGPEPQPSCQQRVGVSALPLTQGDQQRPVYNTIPQRANHKESSAMAGFVQGPTAVRRRKGRFSVLCKADQGWCPGLLFVAVVTPSSKPP